jgi:hypothetical protein
MEFSETRNARGNVAGDNDLLMDHLALSDNEPNNALGDQVALF